MIFKLQMLNSKKIYKIVLTGGPCAGKTTAKALILEKFSSQLNVVCLPELATLTFKSGIKIDPSSYDFDELVNFTKEFVCMQLKIEEYFERLSKNTKGTTLIVCDRGACDTFGYCSPEIKARVLEELGLTIHDLSSNRYDMVIHLTSCANGAPQFYNNDNEARFENIEQAIQCDINVQNVWKHHPSFSIINNSINGFSEKMQKVIAAVGHFINVPESKLVKKFLLKKFMTLNDIPKELHAGSYKEKIVFIKKEKENRIDLVSCKKLNNNSTGFYFYKSRYLAEKEINRVELVRQINKELFKNFLVQKDPETEVLKRVVHTFIHQLSNKNTEEHRIESYELGDNKFSVLRVDCETEIEKIKEEQMLKGLEIIRDVTGYIKRRPRVYHQINC